MFLGPTGWAETELAKALGGVSVQTPKMPWWEPYCEWHRMCHIHVGKHVLDRCCTGKQPTLMTGHLLQLVLLMCVSVARWMEEGLLTRLVTAVQRRPPWPGNFVHQSGILQPCCWPSVFLAYAVNGLSGAAVESDGA